MTTIYVQFTDANKTAIASTFGGPQDTDIYPNQGTVDSADAMYKTYYDLFLPFPPLGMIAPTDESA